MYLMSIIDVMKLGVGVCVVYAYVCLLCMCMCFCGVCVFVYEFVCVCVCASLCVRFCQENSWPNLIRAPLVHICTHTHTCTHSHTQCQRSAKQEIPSMIFPPLTSNLETMLTLYNPCHQYPHPTNHTGL